jgi:hypothetical protein
MPRIPQYESQITPVTGGVAPGSMFLPNIHQETGIPQAWARVAESGKSFENAALRQIGLATREQRVLEHAKAVAEGYKQQGAIEAKYANYNGPDLPDLLAKDLEDARTNIVENVSLQNQKYIAVALEQQFSHSYASGVKAHAIRVQQLNQAELMGNIREIAGTAASAFEAGDRTKYASALGNLEGLLTQVQGKLPGVVKKAGSVQAYADQLIGEARLGILRAENPQKALELLNTPEGRKELGVSEANRPNVLRQVTADFHRQSTAAYNEYLTKILKGERFSNEQILLEGGEEDKQSQVVDLWRQATSLSEGDSETARQVYQNVLDARDVTPATKGNILKYVSKKINQLDRMPDKYEQNALNKVHQLLGKDYPLFLQKYLYDETGRTTIMSQGKTQEDIEKSIYGLAQPFVENHIKNLGKKTGITPNLDSAGAGVGGSAIKPSGRVYDTGW